MCGILAYFSESSINISDLNDFLSSLNSIEHRGPDGKGVVLINTYSGKSKKIDPYIIHSNKIDKNVLCNDDYNLVLGHTRLKIIDLTNKANQPMNFKKKWLTFNGEIYNYLEIKNELKILGYEFKTNSDSEVLLKAYDYWGIDCFPKFNGMWSFIIWDGDKEQIIISNDRFGIKPLYKYYNKKVRLYFSEIKQIKFFNNEVISLNKKNCDLFLKTGLQPLDSETYFNEINRFKKGSFDIINCKSNTLTNKKYYNLSLKENNNLTFKDSIEKFNYLFQDSVSIRTRSDVEIGISISGGVDSSLILEHLLNLNKFSNIKPQSFSAIFPNTKADESHFINKLVKQFGIKSNFINPIDFLNENNFKDHINAIEFPPSSMTYFSQFILSSSIKESGVKVNLVGQGADEVFGGYHKHIFIYFRSLIIRGKILKYLHEVKSFSILKGFNLLKLHKIILHDIYTLYSFKFGLKKVDKSLLKFTYKIDKLSEFLINDFNVLTLPIYLKSDDGNAMYHSIETRLPFLDFRIVNFGFQLPESYKINNGWNKFLLRSSFKKVNNEIKWRKDKKGFSSPYDEMTFKLFNEHGISKYKFRNHVLNIYKKNFGF